MSVATDRIEQYVLNTGADVRIRIHRPGAEFEYATLKEVSAGLEAGSFADNTALIIADHNFFTFRTLGQDGSPSEIQDMLILDATTALSRCANTYHPRSLDLKLIARRLKYDLKRSQSSQPKQSHKEKV